MILNLIMGSSKLKYMAWIQLMVLDSGDCTERQAERDETERLRSEIRRKV